MKRDGPTWCFHPLTPVDFSPLLGAVLFETVKLIHAQHRDIFGQLYS